MTMISSFLPLFLFLFAIPSAKAWLPRPPLSASPRGGGLYYRNDPDPMEQATDSASATPSLDLSSSTTTTTPSIVQSVNYFISRKCNYSCQFCFHTQKTSHHLPLAQAQDGLRLLKDAGTEKINFAGGEPFLLPLQLGELCKTASQELGMAVSIISNGSLITPEWMKYYGKYVDVLGVSVDSFCDETNAKIGRGERDTIVGATIHKNNGNNKKKKKNRHVDRMLRVRDLCDQHDIRFKLNTVVCQYNWQEDMIEQVQQLDPCRWKVFQVLLLDHENMGNDQSLRDARPLVVTDQQFQSFVKRHQPHFSSQVLVPEDNSAMQNSYLLLDEDLRFLDCSSGAKVAGESILEVGVHKALTQAGFDHDMFHQRGGVYDWKRERKENDKNTIQLEG